MLMHVNPVASDGKFTIGYDADSVTGRWPGNMTETCETKDWLKAKEGDEFHDGSELWDVVATEDDELVWRDGDGCCTCRFQTLESYADR